MESPSDKEDKFSFLFNNSMENELNNLDDEIDKYLFDNPNNLDNEDIQIIKTRIKELYFNWRRSLEQKIFVENITSGNIRVKDNDILLGNSIIKSGVTNKSTLYFYNCHKVTIYINTKVNHITLENCTDVNIKTIGGSISGMDCIRCQNVSHVFDNANINFIDINSSTNCKYFLSEAIALNTIINATNSYLLSFTTLDEGLIKRVYKTNQSFFDVFKRFIFQKQGDDVLIKDITLDTNTFDTSSISSVFLKKYKKKDYR